VGVPVGEVRVGQGFRRCRRLRSRGENTRWIKSITTMEQTCLESITSYLINSRKNSLSKISWQDRLQKMKQLSVLIFSFNLGF
jgi:hypothetical protein